jgi:hypothetical protein
VKLISTEFEKILGALPPKSQRRGTKNSGGSELWMNSNYSSKKF